jgi:hypothetical protein
MALEGFDYRRILSFYYTGTTVEPMDAAAPALAAQTRPTPAIPTPAIAAPPDTSATGRPAVTRRTPPARPRPERTSRRIGW